MVMVHETLFISVITQKTIEITSKKEKEKRKKK